MEGDGLGSGSGGSNGLLKVFDRKFSVPEARVKSSLVLVAEMTGPAQPVMVVGAKLANTARFGSLAPSNHFWACQSRPSPDGLEPGKAAIGLLPKPPRALAHCS